MPTTLDCDVLRDLYGSAEIRAAFDSRALVQGWLDAERALAGAQAECGLVPEAAAERIAKEADATLYDLHAVRAGVAESQHPLVPLIRMLVERCGDQGRWVHWGATTQDIIDTGLVLQVRAALVPIERDLRRSVLATADLARRYRDTPMAGRTHGQHAVPITFGLKAASWSDELDHAHERLEDATRRMLTAQLGGAAGTLAAMGERAADVRRSFARRLELAEDDVPWHAARDRPRDLANALAQLSAAAERIATEVIRLQATEVAEVSEPAAPGHVGSSTMPQKRNPMTCEYLVATARLLRGSTGVLADAAAHASERDMALWATEWLALPQSLILAGGLTDKLAHVLEGLIVFPERMRENLALTQGLIMAEAVMMRLASSIGHEAAHELVSAAARRAASDRKPLADVLRETPELTVYLGPAELDSVLEPGAYLGLAGEFVDRVVERVMGR